MLVFVSVFRQTIPTPASEEPMLQVLKPDGTRTSHDELDAALEHVDADMMRQFYRDMVMVRAADVEATHLQRQGQLGLWASAIGQEGAQIGAGHAARRQDYLVPTYREHGVAFSRGVQPWQLLQPWRGINHCGWDPRELNTHPYMIVLGAQAPHAVGYAMGVVRDGAVGSGDNDRDTAVLALFGDGASSEGEVSEAFTWAASFHLPVVFYSQNNQWAISTATSVQTKVPLAQRSRGWGIPSARVDGNDVLAVYALTRLALDSARAGEGPFFIEALTYRMSAHTTSDDASIYRAKGEEQQWRERDPIDRLEKYLRASDEIDDDFVQQCSEHGHELAMQLHHHVHALQDPEPITMFDHVYAEPHPLVEREREQYVRYMDQFETDENATEAVR